MSALSKSTALAKCRQKVAQGKPKHQKKAIGPADIVFHGGNIFTMDHRNPIVEALAVKGERILEVGKFSKIKSKIEIGYTNVVDLQGKTLLPGFIEAHMHAVLLASTRFLFTDIAAFSYEGNTRTKEEIFATITSEIAAENPNDIPLPWCMFMGWDIEIIPDLPRLSADYLDKEFSDKIPLMIIAQSGHAGWVNHKTFEVCNITEDTPNPPGGEYVKDENGKLTGLLLEEPAIMSVVAHSPKGVGTVVEGIKAINMIWKDLAARGFTTVVEIAYSPIDVTDLYLSAKARFEDCPIRLALYSTGGENRILENDKLWVAGCKFWADGSPHAGNAAIREPYLDNELTQRLSFPPPPNLGHLNWSDEELFRHIEKCHNEGKQVAIHANGERAIDQTLDAYAKLMSPRDDRRHRLEHTGLITEQQLKRCAQIGATPSILVDHLRFYGHTFSDPDNGIFGPERTERYAPIATAIKHLGVEHMSIHQDHPAFPGGPTPFANMKTAITRTRMGYPDNVYGPQHRITIDDALKAYTIGPAYQLFREREIGSLEFGKYADLVILSKNPYKVDPMKLDTDVRVVETYIGGRCNNINKQ